MRRMIVTVLALVALLGFVLNSSVIAQDSVANDVIEALALVRSPERLIGESRLNIIDWNNNSLSGELDLLYNGQRVIFRSSRVSSTQVNLHIELGDVVLEAHADLKANTRILDGHDHALSLDQRLALIAFVSQLHLQLQPYQNTLPEHEDLLFRVVNYYAEAPVGWPLKHRVIAPPPAGPLAIDSIDDSELFELGGGQNGGDSPENLSSCQSGCVDGENGITLYSNPCCSRNHTLCHDAHSFPFICGTGTTPGQPHPYCCETIRSGCDIASSCIGRCGPGCGIINSPGEGIYTLNCGDHDRCCGIHDAFGPNCLTPTSVACGDEWVDAEDDFLFAIEPFNDVCTDGCYECCSNSDCGSCEKCVGNTCVPVNCAGCTECNNNHGCRSIFNCCTNDSGCGSCKKCQSGSCVPVSCGTCQECNNNHGCRSISNCCTNNSACGPCERCQGDFCVPVTCSGCDECNNNHGCTDPECCNDNDCSGGSQCIDGFCLVSCGNSNCEPSLNEDSCSCPADCGSPPGTETNCTDGEDDDCDGAVDCDDSDCNNHSSCCVVTENPEITCNDNIDNDCDGDTDCGDSNCDCENYHPADMSTYCGCLSSNCEDFQLDGCEILAYARAWVNGEHNDLAFALRGALIWKQCDQYTFNQATGTWDSNCN